MERKGYLKDLNTEYVEPVSVEDDRSPQKAKPSSDLDEETSNLDLPSFFVSSRFFASFPF